MARNFATTATTASGKPPSTVGKAHDTGDKTMPGAFPGGQFSEKDIKRESGKAAQQALILQQKADDLRQAAYGAGDPDERQKLLEEAIDAEIAAESFGKTAKYLRTGAFQGMIAGGGLGLMPGLTLGALTGTLVGGVVSAITGTLGAGLGALVGAVHGPFWNMGSMIGRGIRSITGDFPGWKATDEQKRKLEEMIAQCRRQKMPGTQELKQLASDAGDAAWNTASGTVKDWGNSAWSYVPSWPSWGGSVGGGAEEGKQNASSKPPSSPTQQTSSQQAAVRRTPRKIEHRSGGAQQSRPQADDLNLSGTGDEKLSRTTPRKLEVRSQGAVNA